MTVPLRQRPYDLLFIAFFAINALIITSVVDLEQLVVADPTNFDYPVWPPAAAVDLVHWWGNNYDPLLKDERYGVTPAPQFAIVVAANGAWLLASLLIMVRMRREHPFTRAEQVVA